MMRSAQFEWDDIFVDISDEELVSCFTDLSNLSAEGRKKVVKQAKKLAKAENMYYDAEWFDLVADALVFRLAQRHFDLIKAQIAAQKEVSQ